MKNTVEYEFLDVIQAGEQFKISLVLDEYGNQAACKSQVDPGDEFTTRQLESQAAFLRGSNHPSIVNFRDNTKTELFMEAMAGELEAQTAISTKRFSSGEIVSFLRQMLTLLSHLDARGMTAGQFSPRTILCDEDFSIFKVAMAYPKDAAIPADPNEKIFPPEINSGEIYDVHASDIYCLGMTCVELVLGATDFEAQFNGMYDNAHDLWICWHENLHESLPDLADLLPGFPIGLVEILQKMIAKPLDLRFDSADEVLNDLNKLGIVDGEVVVKREASVSAVAKVACGLVLAFVGIFAWNAYFANLDKEDDKTEENTLPETFLVSIRSSIPFRYVINESERDRNDCTEPMQLKLKKDDKLQILKPRRSSGWSSSGWSVSINGEKHSFEGRELVAAAWTPNEQLNLEFSRIVTVSSNGPEFEWSSEDSQSVASRDGESMIELKIDGRSESSQISIRPLDRSIKFKTHDPDKRDEFVTNVARSNSKVDLEFVRPIKLHLVGQESLSEEQMKNLTVRVAGQKLDPQNGSFSGDVDCGELQKSQWTVDVKHRDEILANANWNELASVSDNGKEIELIGKVDFKLPDGFRLAEANGVTEFKSKEQVEIPFGEKLKVMVTDRSGVIQFHETVDWTNHFTIDKDEFLKRKKLRNQGKPASYWLVRVDNTAAKTKIGVAYDSPWLPFRNQDQDDYNVLVEWASGHWREIPLRKFLASGGAVEKWPAANSVVQQNSVAGGDFYAVKEMQASR